MGRALAVLGTASDAGKSVLVAGLCRLLARRGLSVAPFKAQNMSLNSDVTPDGGEVARAQALQAAACGRPPSRDMNPVLLKPVGDGRSQVVLRGRAAGVWTIDEYWARREEVAETIAAAYRRLAAEADVVVLEGAGGAAEVNLRDRDLANFWAARLADAPVLLVADIDRGGAFAALAGSWLLTRPADRRRLRGFVLNRLRGDARHLGDGPAELARLTGVPLLGALPHLGDLGLDAEDSLGLDRWPVRFGATSTGRSEARALPGLSAGVRGLCEQGPQSEQRSGPPRPMARSLRVAMVRFPHVSNFTDLEPLRAEAGVETIAADTPDALGGADLVVLPGTKQTAADLTWLRAAGFERALAAHVEAGGWLVGLCGGYQMLGIAIRDPEGVESAVGHEAAGLGLLPIETTLRSEKQLHRVEGTAALPWAVGARVAGYEIHAGESRLVTAAVRHASGSGPAAHIGGATAVGPVLHVTRRDGRAVDPAPDAGACGAAAARGRIFGTYLHGLFDAGPFRRAFLDVLRRDRGLPLPHGSAAGAASGADWADRRLAALDRWADAVAAHLPVDRIASWVAPGTGSAS